MSIASIKRILQKPLAKKILDRLCLATVAYVLAIVFLYSAQDNLIFHPQPTDARILEDLSRRSDIEHLRLTAADGTELSGWFRQGHATGT